MLGTVLHSPGQFRCQVLYADAGSRAVPAGSSSPSTGHSYAHQPQVGPLWQSTSQKGTALTAVSRAAEGQRMRKFSSPWGEHGGAGSSCSPMWDSLVECGDFLKELWPRRARAGACLT